jgi:hypothetical protein
MDDSERSRGQAEPTTRALTEQAGATPAGVLVRFTAAESRIYPTAMTDPEGYERAVRLVGMVAARLREQCSDLDSLLQRRGTLIAALPGLAESHGLELGGLPADVVVDAASALRWRELQAGGRASAGHVP